MSQLLDQKRYELLYRGEGVKRISKPGTPATQTAPQTTTDGSPEMSPPKVDVVTENKYFGKNKSTKAAMAR